MFKAGMLGMKYMRSAYIGTVLQHGILASGYIHTRLHVALVPRIARNVDLSPLQVKNNMHNHFHFKMELTLTISTLSISKISWKEI